jgi:hypothetical protein
MCRFIVLLHGVRTGIGIGQRRTGKVVRSACGIVSHDKRRCK